MMSKLSLQHKELWKWDISSKFGIRVTQSAFNLHIVSNGSLLVADLEVYRHGSHALRASGASYAAVALLTCSLTLFQQSITSSDQSALHTSTAHKPSQAYTAS